MSGSLTVTSAAPEIFLTDTNANSDYSIVVNGGQFRVRDETNSANRLAVNSDGHVDIYGRLDAVGGFVASSNSSIEGNLELTSTYPSLTFTDTNHNSDYRITNNDGQLIIYDITNSAHRLNVNADGHIDILGHLDVGAGIDVTGKITATGTLDTGNATINRVDVTVVTDGSRNNGVFIEPGDTGQGNRPKLRLKGAGNAGLGADAIQVFHDNGSTKVFEVDYQGNIEARDLDSRHADFSAGIDVTGNAGVSGNISVGGVISIPDTIQHVNDTNTKIRFPGADQISFETAGSTRFGLSSSGNIELHGTQTGNNVATIYNGTGFLGFYASSNSGVNRDFRFFSSNSNSNESLRISSNGNVNVYKDLDVDGHTNLDNVNIAGFTTVTQDLDVDGHTNLDNATIAGVTTFIGNVNLNTDLDVDGHTNLDNVSIAGVVTASTFSGSGASLTSIPAGQLTGTVADARISTLTASKLSGALPAISAANLTNIPAANITGTLPAISGANLTNLDASDLASGTIPDARFPATLPAVSGANLTGLAPNVGITTNLSGTFTASAGSPSTINTFGYGSGDLVVEYTIYIKNGSDFQTQKLLAMRDGTTIHSTQFAVMFSSSLLLQCDATISSGNILLRATPETGVSGSTTYKVKREVM